MRLNPAHPFSLRKRILSDMKTLQLILAAVALGGLSVATAADPKDAKDHKGTKECNACCESAKKCDACCHDKGKGVECKACCFDEKKK